jgi:hypothetical protein
MASRMSVGASIYLVTIGAGLARLDAAEVILGPDLKIPTHYSQVAEVAVRAEAIPSARQRQIIRRRIRN